MSYCNPKQNSFWASVLHNSFCSAVTFVLWQQQGKKQPHNLLLHKTFVTIPGQIKGFTEISMNMVSHICQYCFYSRWAYVLSHFLAMIVFSELHVKGHYTECGNVNFYYIILMEVEVNSIQSNGLNIELKWSTKYSEFGKIYHFSVHILNGKCYLQSMSCQSITFWSLIFDIWKYSAQWFGGVASPLSQAVDFTT